METPVHLVNDLKQGGMIPGPQRLLDISALPPAVKTATLAEAAKSSHKIQPQDLIRNLCLCLVEFIEAPRRPP
jgi:hypothetical protein